MRSASDAPRTITLRLEDDGKERRAQIQSPIRFYSPGNALKRLADLRAKLPSLKADLEGVKARGQDISYPQVTLTVLENFVRYAEEDVQHAEVKRSLEQIDDLERMAARLSTELQEALAGDRQFARRSALDRPAAADREGRFVSRRPFLCRRRDGRAARVLQRVRSFRPGRHRHGKVALLRHEHHPDRVRPKQRLARGWPNERCPDAPNAQDARSSAKGGRGGLPVDQPSLFSRNGRWRNGRISESIARASCNTACTLAKVRNCSADSLPRPSRR